MWHAAAATQATHHGVVPVHFATTGRPSCLQHQQRPAGCFAVAPLPRAPPPHAHLHQQRQAGRRAAHRGQQRARLRRGQLQAQHVDCLIGSRLIQPVNGPPHCTGQHNGAPQHLQAAGEERGMSKAQTRHAGGRHTPPGCCPCNGSSVHAGAAPTETGACQQACSKGSACWRAHQSQKRAAPPPPNASSAAGAPPGYRAAGDQRCRWPSPALKKERKQTAQGQGYTVRRLRPHRNSVPRRTPHQHSAPPSGHLLHNHHPPAARGREPKASGAGPP